MKKAKYLKILNLSLKSISLILFAIVTFSLNLPKAYGEGVNLGIYPPVIQIDSTPPAEISTPIEIQNLASNPVELKIMFRPFKTNSNQGLVTYLTKNEGIGDDPLFFQRVKVLDEKETIDSLELAPKQVKKLNLIIDIPKDEPPSDYYFSVIFISKTLLETDSNTSQAAGGIATNVLVSVGPKGKTEGTIEEFSAPFWLEKGPVPFTVKIANKSKHFINPKGEILIKNMFGMTIGRVDLLPVNILSDSTRQIPSKPLKDQDLSIGKIAIWPEKFILGPYTATLTIALSSEGPLFRKSINFIGFPVLTIVGFLIVIFILFVIRQKIKKKLNK